MYLFLLPRKQEDMLGLGVPPRSAGGQGSGFNEEEEGERGMKVENGK